LTPNHPSEFTERWESVPPFNIHIITYRFHGVYHCSVDDVDPGSVISRSSGSTKAAAEQQAIARAKQRLEHSRARYDVK
jgi:hypothetical protein